MSFQKGTSTEIEWSAISSGPVGRQLCHLTFGQFGRQFGGQFGGQFGVVYTAVLQFFLQITFILLQKIYTSTIVK